MTGLVTLLGAGPGDQELITVKGARRLKEADVLVYDRLINQDLFKYLKPDCETIDVGKQPGMPCVRQDEIEAILIEKAREGKAVVRLKSGDPYIFGRGGEEALSLVEAGIDFEVVPGVSSAVAGLTYAGIPMTFRDVATSFHVFTGHLKDETEQLNWEAIAQLKGTLVFLMGMKNLATITSELSSRGFSSETPVAVIEWATHPQQRSIYGTLSTITELVAEHGLTAPSIIVIGDVVSFRQQLNFHEHLPLSGRQILIQASPTGKLPRLLKDDGANLVTFPGRNKVNPFPFKLPDVTTLDGLLVADWQSWLLFLEALKATGQDLRALGHVKVVAVGQHTSKAMGESGLILYAKGAHIHGEDLVETLANETGNWYILAPDYKQAAVRRFYELPVLVTHTVDFDDDLPDLSEVELEAICLPNSLAATNFVAMAEELEVKLNHLPIIVMGETTRAVIEQAGYTEIIETDKPTIAAIRDKCRQLLTEE
ncbi:uroporphyrinogen III methyltransferase/synthase [Streptococcus rupicaprae]|uniref:uroporphyrinogen-III C-methyltransferase n=1 Tax=Streptococcus rupicaprae TaxID=759619 RepID=A0ABV2FF81_9STRE